MTLPTERKLHRFMHKLDSKIARKLKAKEKHTATVWLGLGTMGLIGWSVVVPTLLGAALGLWLDEKFPSVHSWTLTFLLLGLMLGCVNAWHWIEKEDKKMHDES
jgi:ATP synthase protein I